MIAIIALILAALALFGLVFHIMMADAAHGGVAHLSTPLSTRLAERYPATFAPPSMAGITTTGGAEA